MSASRLDDLRTIDPVLTCISQGYSNNSFVAEHLFPMITVSKLKGKVPIFSKDAFIVRDTLRAVRADSNRIPPSSFDLVSFETKERDVEMAIDYIEEEETIDFASYENQITKQLVDSVSLAKEKEAADLAQSTSNYITALKKVLLSTEAFDDYASATDPLSIIKDGMNAVRARIAKYPNTMVMGAKTFNALSRHPKILDKIKYVGIGKATIDIIKELTDIPNIHVGLSVYTDDGIAFSDVWSDNIVLAYIDQNESGKRSEFNPSYGYTFQRQSMPEVDTYYENGGKVKVIRYTDNYGLKVTASDAAYLISHTNYNS
ncbi:MAG: hypothetical protein NTW25_13965 [Candidatus Kapabacteria bacterium]|nr:hypothetical protein [Candidatus Kapabacteria bacterium]